MSVIAALLLLSIISVTTVYLVTRPNYGLSLAAKKLLVTPTSKIAKEISYSAKSSTFYVNKQDKGRKNIPIPRSQH